MLTTWSCKTKKSVIDQDSKTTEQTETKISEKESTKESETSISDTTSKEDSKKEESTKQDDSERKETDKTEKGSKEEHYRETITEKEDALGNKEKVTVREKVTKEMLEKTEKQVIELTKKLESLSVEITNKETTIEQLTNTLYEQDRTIDSLIKSNKEKEEKLKVEESSKKQEPIWLYVIGGVLFFGIAYGVLNRFNLIKFKK